MFVNFMNLFKNAYKHNSKIRTSVYSFSTCPKLNHNVSRPAPAKSGYSKQIGPIGWFLLLIPTTTFALGTWQVERKKWKEELIATLHERTHSDPVSLPENLADLNEMEYRPIHVRGQFLHDKELYIGPRSLIIQGNAANRSTLMTLPKRQTLGYLVVTPFKLSNSDKTILVNRGWVPIKKRNPITRQKGQVQGEVDVIGVVRLQENRPVFSPRNDVEHNIWFHRDLNEMAKKAGTLSVFLDATDEFDVPDGPVGGQTNIALRNEHFSYVLTWYGLCAATSFMWYKNFLK